MGNGGTTRLSKLARELNVGISTIVDFLKNKGIEMDSNPNTKVGGDIYTLLLKEFSSDLSVKKESEEFNLRSARLRDSISVDDIEEDQESMPEPEEEVLIKDVNAPMTRNIVEQVEVKKPELKVVGKIDLTPKKKEKKEEPKPEVKEEVKETVAEAEEVKEEAPVKKDDFKVIGKIDLDSINQKTRPTKKSKKEKEEKKEEQPVAEVKKEEEVLPEPVAVEEPKIEEVIPVEKSKEDFIETEYEKLSGPTVVGKIVLPVAKEKVKDEKKGLVASSDDDEIGKKRKKKRKRIKKEKIAVENEGKDSDKRSVAGKGQKKSLKPEVSDEEVQKQIKDTLARLTTKGKSKGSKYRREKRDAVSLKAQEELERQELEKNIIKVTEFVTVAELASLMSVEANQVIGTCMNLGLFVSINQRLDAEALSLVADEFGYELEFVSVDLHDSIGDDEEDDENMEPRPPIVTVMGHVDHGKTKLLDYIRSANVVAGEAGGITQHIGAYSVILEGGKVITFLDTPGHEAFTAMRARGAQITDISIIMVAADDGVKPQTVEAINHAQAAGVPMVFAINKIDKPGANPEKVKENLANMNILVEDWGGKYQSQEISAKQGINIEDLLEKVLLEAELLELKANPNRRAKGTVIESSLDKGRGYVATVLVQTGTLKIGDVILAGNYYGHVKAMYNERNQRVTEAGPSSPVLILGLNGAPQAGDIFNVLETDREAKEIATHREQLIREQGIRTKKHVTLDEIGRRIAIGNFQELNVIVKGDVDGSIEALADSLIKLGTEEIQVNIIHKAVGQISESDVMLAAASNAIIIGFQVRPSTSARKLAEKEQIDIRLYSIIYDAIDQIKDAMEGMLSPEIREEILGAVEVREVFKITKVGTVAGCFVTDGRINRSSKVRVIRDGIVVFTGDLGSLKRFKDDAKEVVSGLECGLNVDRFNDIKVGDVIEAFIEKEVKKTL